MDPEKYCIVCRKYNCRRGKCGTVIGIYGYYVYESGKAVLRLSKEGKKTHTENQP